MFRRTRIVLGLLVLITATLCDDAFAHAGLKSSNPRDGVRLGDTPTKVELTFYERPELALSSIRVRDTAGAVYDAGPVQAVPGDPLSLSVPVQPLKPGVYIVEWRIVSAVDGHATAGSYAFGVKVAPGGASAAAANTYPAASRFEMFARSILILGLALVVGATAAALARFGGPKDVALAACGIVVTTAGLALLAAAQMHNTGSGFSDLLRTSIGRALMWRGVAIAAAAMSLSIASLARRRTNTALERAATIAVAIAALGAIGVHVLAGHAAGVRRLPALAVGVQLIHFAATGVWLGGLGALILGVRGEPALSKTHAVRRYSTIAGVVLAVVATTGIVRAVQEISTWKQLISTSYGEAVLAKSALLLAIAAFGALNRWHSVPAVSTTLVPLRRIAAAEMSLMLVVVGVAGVLGTLPPPSAGGLVEVGTIDVSGADFATSVRARLTAPSDQAGPNRFSVRVDDYDSGEPVRGARVSLRFTPVDDPGVAPTSLTLEPQSGDTYAGSGSNLSFDGRWTVTVLVERAGTSTEVPLDVEVRGAPSEVVIQRRPGRR